MAMGLPGPGTQRRAGPDPDRKRASGTPGPGRPLAMSHELPLASLGVEFHTGGFCSKASC